MAANQALLANWEVLAEHGLEELPDPDTWVEIKLGDEQLIQQLCAANMAAPSFSARESNLGLGASELSFGSEALADKVRASYDTGSLSGLADVLHEQGTLRLPIIRDERHSIMVDGSVRPLALLAATETGADGACHGDMSSMVYLRDQIQAATALMEVSLQDPDRHPQEAQDGKDLLISALEMLSSPAQLKREGDVIFEGDKAGQSDWPSISLHFNDLEGNNPNGWRNKQDSFQMLAYLTLDALDRSYITTSDLTPAHRAFLAGIVPLLTSVGFPHYESSGSWEEIEAKRTSVMSVETALLAKIQKLPRNSDVYQFLEKGYLNARRWLPGGIEASTSFPEHLDHMVQEGLMEIGRRLPNESPDDEYPKDSVKYREADAALVYLLRYGIPELLAKHQIPIRENGNRVMDVESIEDMVVGKIFDLIDPETGAMIRYKQDSYLGLNFITTGVQMIVGAIKTKVKRDAAIKGVEVDLDDKQSLRNQLTPQGSPAAWTHPLGQMASWFAKRSYELRRQEKIPRAEQFERLGTRFLNTMLSTITGEDKWQAVIGEDGACELKRAPAHKLPECVVTYETANGVWFTAPSPHTPLNWSTAMLLEALGMFQACTSRSQRSAGAYGRVLATLSFK